MSIDRFNLKFATAVLAFLPFTLTFCLYSLCRHGSGYDLIGVGANVYGLVSMWMLRGDLRRRIEESERATNNPGGPCPRFRREDD